MSPAVGVGCAGGPEAAPPGRRAERRREAAPGGKSGGRRSSEPALERPEHTADDAPAPRCLVTGGAGFVGSHLVEALLARGARVRVLDDLSSGRLENLAAVAASPRLCFERGTATDPATVARLVGEADVVFHLAALVGVRRVWEAPEETLAVNVRSTQLVLDAAVRHGTRVLFTSSSEVYGKGAAGPLREDAPLFVGADDSRRWSYAASKAFGEWMAAAHARAHGLEAVCVRLFNVVGPRQRAEGGMVLPRFVEQALRGEPLSVWGDGTQTRTFLDVRDTVRALVSLALGATPRQGVYNVGGTEELSVLALAELVREVVGGQVPIARVPYREAFGVGFDEPRRRRPDLARLRAATGFRPRIALRQTVEECVRSAGGVASGATLSG